MMYLVAAAAILCWLGMLAIDSAMIGTLLVMGGIVFLFAAVMGAGVIVARGRATRQDSLLSVLAIAAERGMPLAPAVLAFADQYRGLLTGGSRTWPPGSTGGRSFPRRSSGRASWSRATRSCWRGSVEAAGRLPRALRMAATIEVEPVADLDGHHRAAFLHPRAAARHADHLCIYLVFYHAQI